MTELIAAGTDRTIALVTQVDSLGTLNDTNGSNNIIADRKSAWLSQIPMKVAIRPTIQPLRHRR
jgi:hypothetical protein